MDNVLNNKKLSIIVPVYNAEEYLGKCLDRLLEQSYKNIEIIIVNDSSQGNCEEIAEKYKVNAKWVWTYTRQHKVPKVRIRQFNYYSKKMPPLPNTRWIPTLPNGTHRKRFRRSTA